MSALDALKEKARQGNSGTAPAPAQEAATPKAQSAVSVKNAAVKVLVNYFASLELAEKMKLPPEVQNAVKTLLHKNTGHATIFQKLFPAPAVGQTVDGKKIYEVFEGNKSVPDCMKYFRKFNEDQSVYKVEFDATIKAFKITKA